MTVDTQNFAVDVIEQSYSKPVLVDFWAEWCGPCRILGPILEKLAEKYSDRFVLVKLNTDHFQDIAVKYNIRGIPNVKLFIDGEAVSEFTGALPEPQVEAWIKKNVPGKNDQVMNQVREMILSGDEDQAAALLSDLKNSDPENKEIDLLLAHALLFKDPEKAADLITSSEEVTDNFEMVESLKTLSQLLKREKKNDFPEGIMKEKYSSAVSSLKEKKFNLALESFIEVIREDRNYDDDGARKACIAIFKYLGEDNPVTQQYRRDFGRALYI